MSNETSVPTIQAKGKVTTRNWYAWNDQMPPRPNHLHVVGEVQVANPGIRALLGPKEPQGINPSILLLDLYLVQQPGIWPQQVTWAPAKYTKVEGNSYFEVEVYFGGQVIAKIPVKDVH